MAADPPHLVNIGDFGAQGGDPSRGVRIDLSTCVNRYGPPPAALDVLGRIRGEDILMHPYDAPARICELYSWATGVAVGELTAGRGVSEFIWALSRQVPASQVAVPLPGYTDYLKAFPGRGFSMAGEQVPSAQQVDAALANAHLVLISNPHNPTGTVLAPADLLESARRHPDALLVVDESYINFSRDPVGLSVIGCDVPNVVVLRSTSKFYGIAAARAGVAWCREPARLASLFGVRETWGLSGIDARVAEAAVRSWDWADDSRRRMHEDSRWLVQALERVPGLELLANENVHFQYAFSPEAPRLADAFAAAGVGVRALGQAHGVRPGALRIVAPRADEREVVASAIDAVTGSG